ncbi:MAG TPA: glucose-1-phosphate adenylyltransferase [Candidatus Sulfotelmatobacter sp.]|jgi:glucose-1-phosphate adenylyltransferase|nr:glucose-1-phosphate adenylyltransferase [Candidatus Sulfotelmatobacter sp.]
MPENVIPKRESATVVQPSSRLRVLGIVLAGGKGSRLFPLTRERAKPAVPFGGKYRIIDFVLSNFVNSGINSIYVLTQFRSQSLLQHLSEGWQYGGLLKSHFIINVPAQMRSETESWYQGTADAIFQNINLVEQSDPHFVAIFGGDHIYRMNVASMIDFHMAKGADVTVAAIPAPRLHAVEFGVVEVNEDGRIMAFHEKKADAPTMPGDPTRVYASMGNYVFSTRTLLELLNADAKAPGSHHDFGMDILPKLAGNAPIYAYNFEDNRIPGEAEDVAPYWRDVGTIEAFYEANMDLNHVKPALNLYNREWPVRSTGYPDPPAKFVFDEANRRGEALDSIVSGGCILSGGVVRKSVLGRGVRVHTGALVEGCVIMDNCDIGRHAKVKRAILDKNVRIPADTKVGYDLEADRARGWHVTESGIVVIGRQHSSVPMATMFA